MTFKYALEEMVRVVRTDDQVVVIGQVVEHGAVSAPGQKAKIAKLPRYLVHALGDDKRLAAVRGRLVAEYELKPEKPAKAPAEPAKPATPSK